MATETVVAQRQHLLNEGFFSAHALGILSLLTDLANEIVLIPITALLLLIAHVMVKGPLSKGRWPRKPRARYAQNKYFSFIRRSSELYVRWFNPVTIAVFVALLVCLLKSTQSRIVFAGVAVVLLISGGLYSYLYVDDVVKRARPRDAFAWVIVALIFGFSAIAVPYLYGRSFFSPQLQHAQCNDPYIGKGPGMLLVFDDQSNVLGVVQQLEVRGVRLLLYQVSEKSWSVLQECSDIQSGNSEKCSVDLRGLAVKARPSVSESELSRETLEADLSNLAN